MSTAEALADCGGDDRLRIEITDGRDPIETIEVLASEYTPADARESINRGLLIVHITAVSDLPGSLNHKLEATDDWDGMLEISARQDEDGKWTTSVLQAWGTETESYTELGYVTHIERL